MTMTGAGVHHLVAEQVARQPDACAVVDTLGAHLTYRDLWARSGRLADVLARRGIGCGDRVAVAISRSPEYVVAMLGVLRTGAAYVPLDPSAPAHRLRLVLQESMAVAVVHAPRAKDWEFPKGWDRIPLPDDDSDDGDVGPVAEVDPEDAFFVIYTSGSTGTPKGALLPHRAIRSFVTSPDCYTPKPGDRVANMGNPSFDIILFEVWSTLVAGATVVILPSLLEIAVHEWRQIIGDHRITAMCITTALLEMVAREEPGAFRSLDTLLFGGEVVDPETPRRILANHPPKRVIHLYGPTETCTFATYFICTADNIAGRERIPIGFPLSGVDLRIIDVDEQPCAPGQVGELCIGGTQVASGYLNQPELTAKRFLRNPDGGFVYRTGDLVRQIESGALEFHGRVDRLVKVRGYRVELEEVERAVVATGKIDAVVVEKVGDGPNGHLVAFLTASAEGADRLVEDLNESLRQILPYYMIPGRWQILPALPINSNGKVDRAKLVATLPEATGVPDQSAPFDPSEPDPRAVVVAVLAEALRVYDVAAEQNFLELGGSSIIAMQVVSRIQTRLRVDIDISAVLLSATVGELGDRVAELVDTAN